MQTDRKLKKRIPCEDALTAIGDIAASGHLLQGVVASGVASVRLAEASGLLFTEIADLAGAAELPTSDSGA